MKPKPKDKFEQLIEDYVKKNFSDVSDVPVQDMGFLLKLKQKLNPGSTIGGGYNPIFDKVELPQENKGTYEYGQSLVHELTHARQRKKQGLLSTIYQTLSGEGEEYQRRPSEIEARQAELAFIKSMEGPKPPIVMPAWTQPEDTRPWWKRMISSPPIKGTEHRDIDLKVPKNATK